MGGVAAAPLALAGCRSGKHAEPSQSESIAASAPVSEVRTRDLGAIGTGSNMFRSGIVHSSGIVFIGTYGPPPGIIWKYDPKVGGKLTKVAAPGEYQLDCMVEAPNGRIYIGTAYNGIVYELDPTTGDVRNLSAPPVESTSWIFTMTRTRAGEIYGGRGAGLFHLDWRTGKMRGLGVVPGHHEAPGVSSAPIIRNLQERPDGLIWGDTNRWLFTFNPKDGKITPVVDVAAYDEACYGIFHTSEHSPFDDLYFAIYPRYNDRTPRHMFMVCRAATGKLEPLELPELTGVCFAQGWWRGEDGKGEPRWLISQYDTDKQTGSVAVVDVLRQRVDERWTVDGHDTQLTRALDIDGPGVWFYTGTPGALCRIDTKAKKFIRVAENPMAVECRNLAASYEGQLGTDTYDCGYVFTFDPDTREHEVHGRPYFDDHRCNYGPAAFAGFRKSAGDGFWFVSNHGEEERTVHLYATDVMSNRHRRIGLPAIQLVRMGDGTVCGRLGRNPPSIAFDPMTCWTPAWIAQEGEAFRYVPGREKVDMLEWGKVGPITPLPRTLTLAAVAQGAQLNIRDLDGGAPLDSADMGSPIVALASDMSHGLVYVALQGGQVARCTLKDNRFVDTRYLPFGLVDRGFFVLPRSGRVVGISGDGTVTVLNPQTLARDQFAGPVPMPAGPAVHPTRDAWYFANRSLTEYTLA